MNNITGITLVFENTEYADIKAEDISIFYCGKIKTEYVRAAVNAIMRQDVCHEMFIELLPAADRRYDSLFSKEKLFRRIEGLSDITSIVMTYDDSKEEEIFLFWNEEDEYRNHYQTHAMSKDGHLYIAVSKKHDVGWYLKKAVIPAKIRESGDQS